MADLAPRPLRRLRLRLVPTKELGWLGLGTGVEITVDGRPLVELIRLVDDQQGRSGGYIPVSLECLGLVAQRPSGALAFAGVEALAHAQTATLLACSCGDVVCRSFTTRVEADDRIVRWTRFSCGTPWHRRADFGDLEPMVFARRHYVRAFARLAPAIGSMLKQRREALANARHQRRTQRPLRARAAL